MGSGVKTRWKIPSFIRHHRHHRRSSSTTTSSSSSSGTSSTHPPKEFLCPISGLLMADPVILPTGQTFERGCVKACIDLGLDPPPPTLPISPKDSTFPPPTPLSSATQLVPNLALRSAIRTWCDSHGLDHPHHIDPDAAIRLVRSLTGTPSPSPPSSLNNIDRGEEVANGEKDVFFDSFTSPPPPPVPDPHRPSKSTPSYYSSPSPSASPPTTSSSAEIVLDESLTSTTTNPNPTATSPLEDQILTKLKSSEVTDQEEGLLLLRQSTRDSKENRTILCTSTVLSSLRPFLLSRLPAFQSNAAASVVNLSLDTSNKIPIVRSGTVPPLVSALKSPHMETRSHAAAALFSLAVDESNKAAIGALGALSPLLLLFSKPTEDSQTRRDSALALYHLSTNCSTNRTKLARMGAARTLLGVVAKQEFGVLGGVALMVVGSLAGCGEGRAALMDAGAVEAVVRMIRRLRDTRNCYEPAVKGRMEQCVGVLYGMSKGSLRFRGLAKAVGTEELLMELMAEEGLQEDQGGGEGTERMREMAGRMLRAMHGEGYLGVLGDDDDDDENRSSVSDPAMSYHRQQRGVRLVQISSVNSSEF